MRTSGLALVASRHGHVPRRPSDTRHDTGTKNENKKKSRSVFYDEVVLNNSPSYEKDFSFLSTKKKPIRNSNKRFMNEQKSDFWKEVDEIIRELESDC